MNVNMFRVNDPAFKFFWDLGYKFSLQFTQLGIIENHIEGFHLSAFLWSKNAFYVTSCSLHQAVVALKLQRMQI